MSGDAPAYNVVFILGKPGCGKGTQSDRIVSEFGYGHMSAGELLRIEVQSGSPHGEMIAQRMRDGQIVPVEITCSLLEKRMDTLHQEKGLVNFIIDGFPRNKDNLDGWNRQMSTKAIVRGVLLIDASDDVCAGRCLGRGSGRLDDNEATLRKRFQSFVRDTMPILDHYDRAGLVFKVNGELEPDRVFDQVRQVFEKFKK
ncbi:hypothetical protein BOX15_Mlig027059g1 [Macrostomum lignano]|uniref:UMP/CMP kinase n=1 Tax=Macrostomum lignano TaxID=282301 RepID=A0A267GW41_9PLAT|nr:hypothetical protein BOX15_Mlig027059g1 [Macrostomum lignano]